MSGRKSGTPFAHPHHGDEYEQDQASRNTLARTTLARTSGMSPFQLGRNTLDAEDTVKRQPASIPTSSFYGRESRAPLSRYDQAFSPVVKPQGKPRRLTLTNDKDLEAKPQYRNATQTHSPRSASSSANSSKALPPYLPSAGLSTRKTNRSPSSKQYADTPIEISDDEEADFDTPRDVGTSSPDTLSRCSLEHSSPLKAKKERRNPRHDSLSPATNSGAELSTHRSVHDVGRSDHSVLSLEGGLRQNQRTFEIASQDDNKHIGASRTSVTERMRDKNGMTRKQALDSSHIKRRKLLVDPIHSSLPNGKELDIYKTVPLKIMGWDEIGKFEEDDGARIRYSSGSFVRLEWSNSDDGTITEGVTLSARDIYKWEYAPNGRKTLHISLRRDSKAPQKLIDKLEDPSIDLPSSPDVDIYLVASSSASEEGWARLLAQLHGLCSEGDRVGLARSIYHESHAKGMYPLLRSKNSAEARRDLVTHPSRPKPRPSVKNARSQSTNGDGDPSQSLQMVEDPNRLRISWPFSGGNYVSLIQSDIEKLEDDQFLNDTLIDFGLRYLMEDIAKRDPTLRDDIYVFSSFFYKRFTEKKRDRKQSYEFVKKWTTRVDIFSKRFLVVPINESLHWYLAVVTNPFLAIPRIPDTEHVLRSPSGSGETRTNNETAADLLSTSTSGIDTVMNKLQYSPTTNLAERHTFDVQDQRSRLEKQGDTPTEEEVRAPSADSESGTLLGGGHGRRKGTPIIIGSTFTTPVETESPETGPKEKEQVLLSSNSPAQGGLPEGSSHMRHRHLRSNGPIDPAHTFDLWQRSSLPDTQRSKQKSWLENNAVVLIFDSLGGKHSSVRTVMRDYLSFEYKDKHSGTLDAKQMELQYIDVAMPLQSNYSDCGLYLLYAFDRFFQAPRLFMEEVIPSRNREHSLWNASEAVTRRKWWKEEVLSLAKQWEHTQEQKRKFRREQKLAVQEERGSPRSANET